MVFTYSKEPTEVSDAEPVNQRPLFLSTNVHLAS